MIAENNKKLKLTKEPGARLSLVLCIIMIVRVLSAAIVLSAAWSALADDEFYDNKEAAIFAPKKAIGSSIDSWIRVLSRDYTYEVGALQKNIHTGEPVVLITIEDEGVEARFHLNAASGHSYLTALTVSNRPLLLKVKLPFDIDNAKSLELLGTPDDGSGSMYRACGDATCSDVEFRIQGNQIDEASWLWRYD